MHLSLCEVLSQNRNGGKAQLEMTSNGHITFLDFFFFIPMLFTRAMSKAFLGQKEGNQPM